MYDMTSFGKVVAELRKKRGLTQEDLGTRLNITPQAISKWENGIGYPDISVMPRLAEVLEVDMDTLFGITDKEEKKYVTASLFEGLPLVHENGKLACYSTKEVKKREEQQVLFCDGSVADLSTRVVINRGRGECRIVEVERVPKYELRGNRFDESFGVIESVKVENSHNAEVVIEKGDCDEARVIAEGGEIFIASLRVSVENCKLRVYNERLNGTPIDGGYHRNKLTVYTGFAHGKVGELSIDGSGDMKVQVGFDSARFAVNGCGDIAASMPCGSVDANINGSGVIGINKADEAHLKINGSGDIKVGEISASLTAKINGAGDITASGVVDTADLSVNGAGDIHLQNMTARMAKVRVSGASDITLGRVLEYTDEKLTKNSTFRVIERG